MRYDALFFINSVLFGVGLAMDAFSVSVANGLREPHMPRRRMALIAGTFAFFQVVMPLLGWLCVHTVATAFAAAQKAIPWIALALLAYLGISMIREGLHPSSDGGEALPVGFTALLGQGVATSIDALSVGFTIADYHFPAALLECLIIGVVTFVICLAGLVLGRRFGARLAGRAPLLGGVILIAIGLEIFITGIM